MKNLLIAIALILSAHLSWAGGLMMMGGGTPASGCTSPASGTVIIGTNTTSSADNVSWSVVGAEVWFSGGWAASWAETCTTTTVGTMDIEIKGNVDGNCKALIANSDGTLITNGISAALAVTYEESASWHTFTFSTPPTVTKGTTYLLAFVCDTGDTAVQYFNNTGSVSLCYDTGDSYATPGTLNCTAYDESATLGGFRAKK